MEKQALTIQIDREIVQEAQELFENLGMDIDTAINIFLHQALKVHGFPFCLQEVPKKRIVAPSRKKKVKRKSKIVYPTSTTSQESKDAAELAASNVILGKTTYEKLSKSLGRPPTYEEWARQLWEDGHTYGKDFGLDGNLFDGAQADFGPIWKMMESVKEVPLSELEPIMDDLASAMLGMAYYRKGVKKYYEGPIANGKEALAVVEELFDINERYKNSKKWFPMMWDYFEESLNRTLDTSFIGKDNTGADKEAGDGKIALEEDSCDERDKAGESIKNSGIISPSGTISEERKNAAKMIAGYCAYGRYAYDSLAPALGRSPSYEEWTSQMWGLGRAYNESKGKDGNLFDGLQSDFGPIWKLVEHLEGKTIDDIIPLVDEIASAMLTSAYYMKGVKKYYDGPIANGKEALAAVEELYDVDEKYKGLMKWFPMMWDYFEEGLNPTLDTSFIGKDDTGADKEAGDGKISLEEDLCDEAAGNNEDSEVRAKDDANDSNEVGQQVKEGERNSMLTRNQEMEEYRQKGIVPSEAEIKALILEWEQVIPHTVSVWRENECLEEEAALMLARMWNERIYLEKCGMDPLQAKREAEKWIYWYNQ